MVHPELEGFCISGIRARLIPTLADSSREGRALSVFLAGLCSVGPFAKAMLGSIGLGFGMRTKINCFTEVVFSDHNEQRQRNDGLILVTTQGGTWKALVEAKIGGAKLEKEQLARYVKLAKANGFDAIITISNQFATLPTHHPIQLPKGQTRNLDIFHWSWMFMLTQAVLLLDVEQTLDPEQRYILSEIRRFFEHDSAAVKRFDRMSSGWRESVLALKSGQRLAKTSPAVHELIGNWHQLQRDLSLLLTRRLKRPVSTYLSRNHQSDQEKRLHDDCENLAQTNQLCTTFKVPDATADYQVVIDLKSRTVFCSMLLTAPKDKKSLRARVNWLLRQLDGVEDPHLHLKAHWPGSARPTLKSLDCLRTDPDLLAHSNKKLAPNWLEVISINSLAGKFSGPRTFVEKLEHIIPDFYEEVGQKLRAWTPPPPKMRPPEIPQDRDDLTV